MIPKFRVWLPDPEVERMLRVKALVFENDKTRCVCGYAYDFYLEDEDATIMQSTGLKDKNGKEIFEGDVVRMRNPRDRRQIGMFQVVRVANSPMLGLLDKKLTTEIFNLYEHMRNYYEIVGNIYENPELLEVTE